MSNGFPFPTMPAKKYRVELNSEEREYLLERIGRGERPVSELTRACVLLKVDEAPSPRPASLNASVRSAVGLLLRTTQDRSDRCSDV
jgi:hypothetical protein